MVERTCDLETGDLGSSRSPPLGQLVTLSELFNLSDPPFSSLRTAGNNAHLTGLLVD